MAIRVDPRTGLTPRQELFRVEYLKDPTNQTGAARKAGYANPDVAACRLLDPARYPAVAKAIREDMDRKAKQAEIDVIELIKRLAAIVRFNIQDVLDEEGRPLPLHEIPREIADCIQEYEVQWSAAAGKGGKAVKMKAVKIKGYSKLEAMKQLAMHLGSFNEWQERQQREGNVTNNNFNAPVSMNWAQLTVRNVEDIPQGSEGRVVMLPPVREDEPTLEKEYVDEP